MKVRISHLGMPKFDFLSETDIAAVKSYLLSRRKELTGHRALILHCNACKRSQQRCDRSHHAIDICLVTAPLIRRRRRVSGTRLRQRTRGSPPAGTESNATPVKSHKRRTVAEGSARKS